MATLTRNEAFQLLKGIHPKLNISINHALSVEGVMVILPHWKTEMWKRGASGLP